MRKTTALLVRSLFGGWRCVHRPLRFFERPTSISQRGSSLGMIAVDVRAINLMCNHHSRVQSDYRPDRAKERTRQQGKSNNTSRALCVRDRDLAFERTKCLPQNRPARRRACACAESVGTDPTRSPSRRPQSPPSSLPVERVLARPKGLLCQRQTQTGTGTHSSLLFVAETKYENVRLIFLRLSCPFLQGRAGGQGSGGQGRSMASTEPRVAPAPIWLGQDLRLSLLNVYSPGMKKGIF